MISYVSPKKKQPVVEMCFKEEAQPSGLLPLKILSEIPRRIPVQAINPSLESKKLTSFFAIIKKKII